MKLMDRAAGACGIVGVPLVVAFVSLSTPIANPDDPSSAIAEALVENRDDARLGAYIGFLGAFLLIVFVARLHGALRNATGPGAWAPTVALIGGILLVVTLVVDAGFSYAASELQSYGQETQVATFFVLWSWNSANLYAPGLAALLTGTSLVVLRTNTFPGWYRWISVALLFIMALIVTVLRAPGLATAPGMLWILITSILLAVVPFEARERRADAA